MAYDNGFLNTNIIPKARTNPAQTFATGRRAIAICDRCGWKYPWMSLRTEPGTLYKVCQTCNDGRYSLVCHPQNFVATNVVDAIALRWARPELASNVPGDGYPPQNSHLYTNPWYLSDENGNLLEWDQITVLQMSTSSGPDVGWLSGPFGYGNDTGTSGTVNRWNDMDYWNDNAYWTD